MNNKLLGLARLTDAEHQREIDRDLSACFDDLLEITDGIQENIERLQDTTDRILHGSVFHPRKGLRSVSGQINP